MHRLRQFTFGRRGATALEFALVAGVFLPLCLAIFDAGLLLWTKGALHSAAALTARCAAITSPDCADAQQYAVTTAGNWIFPGIIAKADVSLAPTIGCLSNASFMKVTITCQFWAGALLPPPLNGKTITAVAYFPVASPACA